MIRRYSLISLLCLALLATSSSAAANPEELLSQAEQAYEQLEYEKTLELSFQVQAHKDATPVQKARAYLYMGVCFTALGDAQNAVSAFVEVLKLRPQFRIPPGVSPSIRAMFNAALQYLKLPEVPPPEEGQSDQPGQPDQQPPTENKEEVKVTVFGPKKVVAGKPIEIRIHLDDKQKQVAKLLINWRRLKGPDYSTVKIDHKTGLSETKGTIPSITVGTQKGTLVYYVVAQDKQGQQIGQAGAEDEPLELELLEPPKSKNKWGWYALAIGGGAAVVAGAVVAAVLLTRGGKNAPPFNTADVIVTLR
ncbi:MAG: tetratricopeptide repeat protein [Pseudomonadota bacterium]